MNILHIITHYDPVIYGAENFAKHTAEYQASSSQNQIYLVTGRWDKSWKSAEEINGVKVWRAGVVKLRYIQTLLATVPLYFKSAKLLKENKIDLVHAHIYPGMLVGFLLHKFNHTPFITTIQGGDIGDYDEVFGPFKIIARTLIGACLKQAKYVHCVSSYLAGQVAKMGVDHSKIIIIPNGVDLEQFKASQVQKTASFKTIKLVSTSRLEHKNNLVELIQILAKIKRKGLDISLDIFGTGSQKAELESEIKKLGLEDSVLLKGYIDQAALSQILPGYDYFIRLSTQEGFGISFIEAMACGVVPIGTRVGGIVDIIDDGKNGYLLSNDKDPEAQITQILKSGNRRRIALAARAKVEAVFDWKVILPKVDKLYV